MDFSSINIQGNIISSEILDKIRTEEKFKHQSPEAFGLSRNASLRDEIGMAWSIMRTHWQAYKKRLETLPMGDTGTSLTREKLIIPLLSELTYEIGIQKAQQVNGKSYAISHSATNKDMFPIHIMGYNDNLDKRRDAGGPRLSPHALVQEYINNTEHLFAIVTNGRHLRLLRDATRLVRMSYLEFDLERIFEEELYADFSLLFRVLHSSRMPEKMDAGADSVIEYYHQESMASGTRIREKLSEAVENSIKTLANGFLAQRKNVQLISQFENKEISAEKYYSYQLRLIYRILFLIVLEERNLVYPEVLNEDEQRFRTIYYRYYSIERLRKLTENRVYIDADKYDLWESLKATFLLFEYEEYGSKIGIKPLGSGLFSPTALGNLEDQFLNNGELINVLKSLTTFVGDHGQLVRVNYSDLDVEEFGSVYEGLLEYDPIVEKVGGNFQFSFVLGDGRSSSGSHYTPEELVKPLIKHSLEYIIADKLKEPNPEEALLSITVCDVACGSGHILLSAARKIATELASIREGAEQPSPTYYRAAIRDVIRNCIYGVDLNPLAVELCKVALWLEAHNPNEPLNFLDHHIKCGNAIVGLAHFKELENGIASEAFKTLPEDDKEIAIAFKKRNDFERKTSDQLSTYDNTQLDNSLEGLRKDFADFEQMPEKTPAQIEEKHAAYEKLTSGKKWFRINNLADMQVAQFFIPKTIQNKESLTTEAKYRTYLNSGAQIHDRGASMAIAAEKRFFHWFLEFPEVFGNGGFDCILGNPPFKGGADISKKYGLELTNYLYQNYPPARNRADFVTYFVRRISNICKASFSFISTNSISEGDTRIGGIEFIINNEEFEINHAIKSLKWPGVAKLYISVVTFSRIELTREKYINGKNVDNISSFLDSSDNESPPKSLIQNNNQVYLGCKLLGDGFILSKKKYLELVKHDKKTNDVVKTLINGRELGQNGSSNFEDFAINFHDWTQEKASKYDAVFDIVKNKVKLERQKQKEKSVRENWWLYARSRQELYSKLNDLDSCFVWPRTSKYLSLRKIHSDTIFTDGVCVYAVNENDKFAIIQSTIHFEWAHKYSSKLKNDLRYSNTDAFETFPMPIKSFKELASIGKQYQEQIETFINNTHFGITKTYNLFHSIALNERIDLKEKTVSELNKQLKKNGEELSLATVINALNQLRLIRVKMDMAVISAYDWSDIDLRHDFYEVDYLPENDRVRFTIHPDARKEILKRLLLLNHERFEEEVKQGLHNKKDVIAYYLQKGEKIPEGVTFSDGKKQKSITKKKASKTKSSEIIQGQAKLFEVPDLFNSPFMVSEKCKVTLQKEDGKISKYAISDQAQKESEKGDYKQIDSNSKLAEIMLGRKVDDIFVFDGAKYKILGVE